MKDQKPSKSAKPNLVPEGKFIRDTRIELGYSQTQFAQYMGTSQPKLSKIEKGSMQIGIAEWFYFCKVSRVPVVRYWEFLAEHYTK